MSLVTFYRPKVRQKNIGFDLHMKMLYFYFASDRKKMSILTEEQSYLLKTYIKH
jgi:hypothetical protein